MFRPSGVIAVAAGFLAFSGAAVAREIGFEERIAAQRAIDRVYYAHQGGTLEFDAAMPRSALEAKVKTYLEESAALDRVWRTPVTAEMLERELRRIEGASIFPGRLQALYAALGNDSVLIQETLVRPALSARLTRSFFEGDRAINHDAWSEAEELHLAVAGGTIDPREDHERRRLEVLDEPAPPSAIVADGAVAGVLREIEPIRDAEDALVFRVAISGDAHRTTVAAYRIPKLAWETWWPSIAREFHDAAPLTVARPVPLRASAGAGDPERGPQSSLGGGCLPFDTWHDGILKSAPVPRYGPSTAVWTGSHVIVFGGTAAQGEQEFRTQRYDPVIDAWSKGSPINAPTDRTAAKAVWTGTEMILFGGLGSGGGGRYNPSTDTWQSLSTVNQPVGRVGHSALWTGTEMIVWGGNTNTGSRYNPATDTWTPMSTAGAPTARRDHAAVWTGSRMIVWGGGAGQDGNEVNTGGSYNPATNTWSPISTLNAPDPRAYPAGVWTGSQLIVWGGYRFQQVGIWFDDGGRYDPATDSWSPMSSTNAPTPRSADAIWTGSEMIVWGGTAGGVNGDGARYKPATDTWAPVNGVGSPSPRSRAVMVWTGSRMIVLGGHLTGSMTPPLTVTGGQYDPSTDTWVPTATVAPTPRRSHTAVWTGNVMIVWGGTDYDSPGQLSNSGGRYDPVLDTWTPTALTGVPARRGAHTSIWTGSEMLVWGGSTTAGSQDTGGRYDPMTDSWTPLGNTGGPGARSAHTAVWTGSEMIVWGGSNGPTRLNTGARYNPATGIWTPIAIANAPSARVDHTAIWTGSRMVVWGGDTTTSNNFRTGGRYDPTTDSWLATSLTGAPTARRQHTAVWTGQKMIVWGGSDLFNTFNTGGRYDPAADTWQATSTVGASINDTHTAVWTGTRMIIWSGLFSRTGNRYDPVGDAWEPTDVAGAPDGRTSHTAVWTGDTMIVWGGFDGQLYLNNGSVYSAADLDSDHVSDSCDNCPATANTGQKDLDADAHGDLCDCAPSDASAFALPLEASAVLWLPDKHTLTWAPAAGTVSDAMRGIAGQWPVGGGAGESCVASGANESQAIDSTVPSVGATSYYLVRGRNVCGAGTYGFATSGVERLSAACP